MRLAGLIYGADRPPFEGAVVIEGRSIVALEEGVRPGSDLVDLRPARLVPGFIDLHIHGGGGWRAGDPAPGATAGLSRFLASQGTTAYFASLMAMTVGQLEAGIAVLAGAVEAEAGIPGAPVGARLLGIHLEGPFLNPARKGAMPADSILIPDRELMDRWLALGRGHVRQVTIAPEMPGALPLIRYLAERGLVVTGGHTDATYEESRAGIDAGITVANHTFNTMSGLNHRTPGAVGAYLTDPRVTCELICDLHHLHPAVIALALAAKGLERATLISDAVHYSCLPPGDYPLGDRRVHVDEAGACRLPDGTIAGSAHHQVAGVANLVRHVGLDLAEAVQLASTTPARVAGVGQRKGRLLPGFDVDVVALTPDFRVQLTLVEGAVVYRSGETGNLLNPVMTPSPDHS